MSPKLKRASMVGALLASAIAILACEAITTLSFAPTQTPTRTRTPRATFTPIPQVTATLDSSPTPDATSTPAQSPTPTRRGVVVAPTRVPTKPPAPPPPPSLPVKLVVNYGCGQADVFEIIGSIRRPGSVFLGNYVLALLSPDGRILKTAVSVPDDQQIQGLDISCQRSGILPYNVKLDATEFRTAGQLIVRVIKSASDPTPLSVNVTVDMSVPGRTFVFFDVP